MIYAIFLISDDFNRFYIFAYFGTMISLAPAALGIVCQLIGLVGAIASIP